MESGDQMITCKFTCISQNLTWYLSTVYFDCRRNERKELWGELAAPVRSLCEGPWFASDDFNVARYPVERTECQEFQ